MGPGFESLIAYKKKEAKWSPLFCTRIRGPYFISLRESAPFRSFVALRAISFAYSLRPDTLEPALLEDVELAGGGAL